MTDLEIFDCIDYFLNLPVTETLRDIPLNYEWIRGQQQVDAVLLAQHQQYPQQYIKRSFENTKGVIWYVRPEHIPNSHWKIALAASILQPTR